MRTSVRALLTLERNIKPSDDPDATLFVAGQHSPWRMPGDCWEARLPTTLMWLEDEAQLPQNETRRLGKPPHAPKDPYCPAATPDGGGKPPNA